MRSESVLGCVELEMSLLCELMSLKKQTQFVCSAFRVLSSEKRNLQNKPNFACID